MCNKKVFWRGLQKHSWCPNLKLELIAKVFHAMNDLTIIFLKNFPLNFDLNKSGWFLSGITQRSPEPDQTQLFSLFTMDLIASSMGPFNDILMAILLCDCDLLCHVKSPALGHAQNQRAKLLSIIELRKKHLLAGCGRDKGLNFLEDNVWHFICTRNLSFKLGQAQN